MYGAADALVTAIRFCDRKEYYCGVSRVGWRKKIFFRLDA